MHSTRQLEICNIIFILIIERHEKSRNWLTILKRDFKKRKLYGSCHFFFFFHSSIHSRIFGFEIYASYFLITFNLLTMGILRRRMTDEKLNMFSLMSIENEMLYFLNMDKLIMKFILLRRKD